MNGAQTSENDTGDYYPLWLQDFVRGIFDPVPNAQQWEGMNAKISQIILPNGQRSEACVRAKSKIGSDTVKNDAFSNVCFGGDGTLKSYGSPGYSMEFQDYRPFGDQLIARRYQDDPESGTEVVADLTSLDELKTFDPSLFAVNGQTPSERAIQSVQVEQSLIERSAVSGPPIDWPPVHSGNMTGLLSMYISVDRSGKVREAYPLNSDNAGLQDAARDQLLKWQLKPAIYEGVPVQVEAALSFRFSTSSLEPPSPPPAPASSTAVATSPRRFIAVSAGVFQGLLISNGPPVYPEAAKQAHIEGTVVLAVTVDEQGKPEEVRVVSSPDGSLAEAAMVAVRGWRYRPYLLNRQPVGVKSMVNVVFKMR